MDPSQNAIDRVTAPSSEPHPARRSFVGRARVLLRYPDLLATIAVGIVGGVLVLFGQERAAQWLISIFVLAIAVLQLVRMVREFRRGRWGLDVLAVLAIGSTTLLGNYWAALVVALMVTGGTALEDYASNRARRQVSALLARVPRFAHRIEPGGEILDVPIDEVRVDDRLSIRPGDVVPVDCILLDDEVEVDESSISGESLPVLRTKGELLSSGSVNGGAAVIARAAAIAEDSQYQQIIALVAAASDTRGRYVRLADRFAIPFTVIALVIAGGAWLLSGDPLRFAQVLVVATPCPLLIAAPAAFVAGMGRSAREGVIIKSGESLERLARPTTVAFDKTGTLTRGQPVVDRVEPTGRFASDELLRLAASAELTSNHVLAEAIVRAAEAEGLELAAPADVIEEPGNGIRTREEGQEVVVGKARFVAQSTGVEFEPAALEAGEMAVYVGIAGQPAGRIVLRDEVRAESQRIVSALRSLGVRRILMVTGDALVTARHVGDQVGIDEVHAGLLPSDKVAVIAGVTERPVLMVGDGVNDAPVLAAADVGVAMGARGSTAASETADVVVMVDDVDRLLSAIVTARRTVTIATQSIGIGIGLSLIFMLIAAFGVIPVIIGALIQEAVDVVTILNGLRAGAGHSSRVAAPERVAV